MHAFINILTISAHAVEDVATFTITAIGAHLVDTTMTFTERFRPFAFINIYTARALFVQVVSSTTVNNIPLTDVGASCVDTELPSLAWACLANTFIDVNADAQSILDIAGSTLDLGETAE